ncbi:hypothetical protein EAG_08395, partial [Camponotus floridanus]
QQTAYVWSSVCLGALSMLAKETGVTVLALNLLYDLCRSWHSIKRSIFEAKWNDDSRYFSRRAAALLVSDERYPSLSDFDPGGYEYLEWQILSGSPTLPEPLRLSIDKNVSERGSDIGTKAERQ